MKAKIPPPKIVLGLMGISFLIFWFCSSLRHFLLQSNAYDLGWFDQLIYLVSVGLPPLVSFAGDHHLLGDHAAVILYPLALFYKIYPSVHWLLVLQALALSLGGGMVWQVARQMALSETDSLVMVGVYFLYPLIFNVNLYDFHPEVFAIPGFLGAIWTARSRHFWGFLACVLLILSCKAVLSLTVAAMGLWLIFFEKRPGCGAFALSSGVAWFLLTTQVIIPQFSGAEAAAVGRYNYLGDSVLEIALNLFLKPHLVGGQLLTLSSLEYFVLLLVPVFWGILPRNLTPLLVGIPTLVINLLSENFNQRNLVHQYSVPLFPFLLLVLMLALRDNHLWIKSRKFILLWSVVGFLCLTKYSYFWTLYAREINTWDANRNAIPLIPPTAAVIAPARVNPHLTHRPQIQLPRETLTPEELEKFDAILLDQRNPGFGSSPSAIAYLMNYYQQRPQWEITFTQDDVVLFQRR